MLSIMVLPTNPQKNTMNGFPINIASINFLSSILLKPAELLTAKDGVNGIDINNTKFLNFIFPILFKNKSIFPSNFICLYKILLNPFLKA